VKHTLRLITAAAFVGAISLSSGDAHAQATPPPSRDKTWGGVSDALVVSSLGVQLLMPRIYSAEDETTEGWKARWHLSALAPLMTISTLSLANQLYFKDSFKGDRPGCDDTNRGGPNCTDFGGPSTHSFAATSLFVHGTAVFLVDTFKWSHGRVNPASAIGNVGVPLILGIITMAGRSAGNYESGGQIVAGATAGLAVGLVTGLTYALLQRPDCGYAGGLVCW
jgi:hypothetical protein